MNVFFVSLGCDKNLVDSEYMIGKLQKHGYDIVLSEEEADVIVVNTCGFIESAREESINTILEMASYKDTAHLKGLVVTGCMAQRYPEEIRKELPEVDAVIGVGSEDWIIDAINSVVDGSFYENVTSPDNSDPTRTARTVTTGGHFAYLKIAEGCDKRCTYCAIPSIRGNYRSFPIEVLIEEAKNLVSQGVSELILVAQETTLYGLDLYKEKKLPLLLRKLSEIEELRWIRLLYCYPEEITDELIDEMASNPKVLHYLDMPTQHCCDDILKSMGRRTRQKELLDVIAKLRDKMPDICLRTSLICGFPGETGKHHREVIDFIKKAGFDRLGAFAYSQEEGTPAAEFDNQVAEEIKKQRVENVMLAQQKIIFKKNKKLKKTIFEVIVEGYDSDNDVYVGRTYRDTPDVDGLVFFSSDRELMTGDFVNVMITGSNYYDLIGEMI